jgi:hypothetical protein
MENNHSIATALATTFSDLKKSSLRFTNAQFNQKPTVDAWSPAMVLQHLILAGKGFDGLLLGNTKPTEGAPDQKVEPIKNIFLNFEAKYKSPEFIEPNHQIYERESQMVQLQQIADDVLAILPNLNLSETCLDFEFPGMGYLTRLELISFLIYHTQRHTHQLSELADSVETDH